MSGVAETIAIVFLLSLVRSGSVSGSRAATEKPNIIVFLADDLGYQDLHSLGHPSQEPNAIDTMLKEGMVFKNMYAADSVCAPSRASLLTARMPGRVGVYTTEMIDRRNFEPYLSTGLPHYEYTMAEALRDAGYRTGMVGKWHLGINRENKSDGHYLPGSHGFDYVGLNLPAGNEWDCDDTGRHMVAGPVPMRCFLYDNDTIIQQPFDHINLTQRFTENAQSFINKNKDGPFFFYFSFAHMHTSMFSGVNFSGRSRRGMYGDGVMEMAWAVGEVIDLVKSLHLAENTLAIFTSDNGPHIELCLEGGTAGALMGGKGSFYEGGIRVPTVFWWPGQIAAGTVSYTLTSQMDILPTVAELAGGVLPDDREYDGVSIADILAQTSTEDPHDYLYFFFARELFAVRHGPYKVVFQSVMVIPEKFLTANCTNGIPKSEYIYASEPVIFEEPLFFNVDEDPNELFTLPITGENADIYNNTMIIADLFWSGFEFGEALLDDVYSVCGLQPCCDTSKLDCVCNYENSVTPRQCR